LASERTHDPVSGISYTFEDAGDDLIVHSWLEPGGALPPHLHPIQEERWSVVEGSATFRLGNERRLYRPEDGEMLVPPGTVHGIESASDEVARLRTYVAPALRLRAFLEESAAAARDGLFTQRGLPRGLRGTRWAASFIKRYGDETVFVSPPRPLQKVLVALFARD